jgi:hypothetical protein
VGVAPSSASGDTALDQSFGASSSATLIDGVSVVDPTPISGSSSSPATATPATTFSSVSPQSVGESWGQDLTATATLDGAASPSSSAFAAVSSSPSSVNPASNDAGATPTHGDDWATDGTPASSLSETNTDSRAFHLLLSFTFSTLCPPTLTLILFAAASSPSTTAFDTNTQSSATATNSFPTATYLADPSVSTVFPAAYANSTIYQATAPESYQTFAGNATYFLSSKHYGPCGTASSADDYVVAISDALVRPFLLFFCPYNH